MVITGECFYGEVHRVTLGCLNGDPQVEIDQHIFAGSTAAQKVVGRMQSAGTAVAAMLEGHTIVK